MDEGDIHYRLTRIVDENLGYRPTMPVEQLLGALEKEFPELRARAEAVLSTQIAENPKKFERLLWRIQAYLAMLSSLPQHPRAKELSDQLDAFLPEED